VVGLAAHQVGDLQGEDAGEGVYADVVIGPVVHGRERDDVGVFELAEAGLGVGLGAVGGDDVGDGPVLAVGDEDPFAEDLGFQRVAGDLIDLDGESVLGGCRAQFRVRDSKASPD